MRIIFTTLLAGMACAAGLAFAPQDPTYWCPMHPDVRGAAGAACPLCGMALVRVAAADYRPYPLDFEVVPRALRPGQPGRVRFFVRDPRTGATVRRFEQVHERVFHLFVLSRDLEYFAHLHPLPGSNGSLDVDLQVPRPGPYQLIADFLPAGGTPQLVQRSFVTAVYTGSLLPPAALTRDVTDKVIGATRVKLTLPEPMAGREQLITFDLQDAVTGAAVSDLEPYLGATGHLLVASADLAVASHFHPVAEISGRAGPTVVFQVLFPSPGDYRMWAQFQRHGQVLTAPFTFAVSERD